MNPIVDMITRGDLMYVLKMPDGTLVSTTISSTKTECWAQGFNVVAHLEGQTWKSKYWKRWDASLRSAKRLGYSIVKVKLVQIAK